MVTPGDPGYIETPLKNGAALPTLQTCDSTGESPTEPEASAVRSALSRFRHSKLTAFWIDLDQGFMPRF
jgi:hypothetical protein